MTLRAFYNTEAEVPEALKGEYVEKDGKWVLDAEGMVQSSELSTLRTRMDEFRQNNIELTEKLKKFDGKKTLSAEEQEEYDRIVQQQQDIDDKKLIDAGKIDELLSGRTEKMRSDFESQIASLTNSLEESKTVGSTATKQLSKVLIRAEISRLLSDQGISPVKGALEDIFARAGQIWSADGKGALQAVKENGEKIYGGEGKELTLEEWGQTLVKEAPYLFVANDGSGGKGNDNNQGNRDNDGVMRIPRSNEAMKSKHLSEIASGKAILVDG